MLNEKNWQKILYGLIIISTGSMFYPQAKAEWAQIKTNFDELAMSIDVTSWQDSLWCVTSRSLLVSSNGINWVKPGFSKPWYNAIGLSAVSHRDRIYVIATTTSTFIYSSGDGEILLNHGSISPFYYPTLEFQTALSFLDKLWILGGYNYYDNNFDCKGYEGEFGVEAECYPYSEEGYIFSNSVLSSDWGTNWKVTWAPWQGRSNHTSIVFDNKIWVIGGVTGEGDPNWENIERLNDVWFSEDGENWIQATASAPWASRYAHESVVFDNKIWVLGGDTKEGSVNDVWSSEDGVNWTLVMDEAPWSPRSYHACTVHNNNIWLIGGIGYGGWCKDVWVYEPDAEGEGEAETIYHHADWHGGPDRRIDLTELLRIIQFYTSDGYCCAEPGDPLSDEGYLPGDGDRTCTPHAADYNPQDWRINLSEVLRVIQFYNSGGYRVCDYGEDGFCPGR